MTVKEFNNCLQLMAKGNNLAFEPIYNKYRAKFFITARLDVKNDAIAQDIVSNAFLSILNNSANYKYIANPDLWMRSVIIFAIINYKKQNAKYVYTEHIDAVYYTNNVKTDFKIEVRKAVEKLPQRLQNVFLLHFIWGYKISDTARQLNVSKSTVNRDINEIKENLEFLINI